MCGGKQTLHVYLLNTGLAPNRCPLQGRVDLVTDVLSNAVTVHAGKGGGMEERGAPSPDGDGFLEKHSLCAWG